MTGPIPPGGWIERRLHQSKQQKIGFQVLQPLQASLTLFISGWSAVFQRASNRCGYARAGGAET